jgi:hypothetical protein
MPAFWPLVLLAYALELAKEPASIARKAARAHITANNSMDPGLFSQLPASELENYAKYK